MPRPSLRALALAVAIAVTGGIIGTGVAHAAKPIAAASVDVFVAPLLAAHDDARAGFFPVAARHCFRPTKHGVSRSCATSSFHP